MIDNKGYASNFLGSIVLLEVASELIEAIQDGGKLLHQLSRRCRFQIED